MEQPCSWPVSYAQCESCTPLEDMDTEKRTMFEQMAASYLWNWTNRTFGTCEITIDPCRTGCMDWLNTFNGAGPYPTNAPYDLPRPVIIDGLWYNVGCGRCGDECRCGGAAPLRIPGPVVSVESVMVDGDALPSSSYDVQNNILLRRLDGKAWPDCGLQVTYVRGTEVPVGGQVAAGVLACELAKAASGDKSCSLPSRVQTITRQGVTIAMLDAFDDIDKGHTGIWIIDSWLASVTKPTLRATVLSPDRPRESPRRTTWRA